MSEPDLASRLRWPYVQSLLPPDIEETAREYGAVVRCRGVPSAAALVRLALAYAVTDLSLKDVAACASAEGVAELTGPGLFYRLRVAETWLEHVVGTVLQSAVGAAPAGLHWRVVDATVITGPGSTGTDWRVHASVDPETGKFRSVEITDAHGGEGLGRFPIHPDEIVLGDRAYATARGIEAASRSGGYVLVRANRHAIRLCDERRAILDLGDLEAQVPQVGAAAWPVLVPVPPVRRDNTKGWPLSKASAWLPARVIGGRTDKGEVIWLISTVPADAIPDAVALEAYRIRWQVELFFKRIKSLLHLDSLPTRSGPTARSWMLAKLLAAALAQKLTQPSGPLSPWGYDVRQAWLQP